MTGEQYGEFTDRRGALRLVLGDHEEAYCSSACYRRAKLAQPGSRR